MGAFLMLFMPGFLLWLFREKLLLLNLHCDTSQIAPASGRFSPVKGWGQQMSRDIFPTCHLDSLMKGQFEPSMSRCIFS